MNKLRKIVLLLSGITIIAIILMFIQSLGNTYVESSSSSYSIYKMNGGEQTTKFNSIISQYAKKHNISVLKVFTVLPEKSSNSDAVSKIHVYGKNLALPKGTRATKKEFETSGVYFSYYFVGKTNPASIERMFDKNGIKYNKINESWIWDISNYLEASSMGYVFLIVLVILLVVLLLTNLRELKKMNIRALLGVSNSRDAWESFLEDEKIFSFAFFGGIILIMIYMYLENYRYSYHIMLFACVLAYLIVGVIIGINAIIRAKMHNYYTIIPAIKGDAHSNMAFFINLSIKIMIEVVLCVILASMLKTWNREQKMTAQLSEWTSHQTYYTVTIGTGTDTENHDVDKKSIKFANYMLDHGGMLIDFQGWGSKDVFDTVEGNHLLVNAKYLDNNKVLNLSGNRIHLSSNTKTTYLLIPERYYSKRKKLIKLYRTFLSLDEAEKTTGKSLSLKAIAIKNNQSHFLYSINSFDYGNYSGSVKDSLLVVVSHKSLGGGGWNNPANMNWTSYVSDSALMTNDLSLLHRAINKTGFTPYVGGILNTKSYAAKQIASTQKKLLVTVIVAIISIFLALFEDIAFNTVYISNNRKKLAIKRLMGANYLKQFGEFILIILGVGVVEATLVYLITQKLSLSLGVFIIGNLLELSLLMLQGMHLNKKISETIKGE